MATTASRGVCCTWQLEPTHQGQSSPVSHIHTEGTSGTWRAQVGQLNVYSVALVWLAIGRLHVILLLLCFVKCESSDPMTRLAHHSRCASHPQKKSQRAQPRTYSFQSQRRQRDRPRTLYRIRGPRQRFFESAARQKARPCGGELSAPRFEDHTMSRKVNRDTNDR